MLWMRDPEGQSIPNPARRASARRGTALAGAVAGLVLTTLAIASARAGEDWPMWGGSPDRNLVSDATGLPTEFASTRKKTKNIRWAAKLGSQTYGNPIVADGRNLYNPAVMKGLGFQYRSVGKGATFHVNGN